MLGMCRVWNVMPGMCRVGELISNGGATIQFIPRQWAA